MSRLLIETIDEKGLKNLKPLFQVNMDTIVDKGNFGSLLTFSLHLRYRNIDKYIERLG